jgi:hypothetical protein
MGVLSTPSPPRIHTYIVTIKIRKYVTFCCDIDELRTHHLGEDFPHRVHQTSIVTITIGKYVTFHSDIDEFMTYHLGEYFPHRVQQEFTHI